MTELKSEVTKLRGELELLKTIKVTPQEAAGQILDHLKQTEVDPIMATDNPWRPASGGCCTMA
eukprot:CAMPEP_0184483378 /NCGR_PEP_ID=MMETSP0113_2-20130426/5032_1 /TAXON_ID=91329 /ORGANISM="Norrisiella sphaerica, Strain BC52" /LENGTH=62 /DNA_ID=CAMNT_0026863737 /DNA_START=69 /DNA_END=257 /DNA_ORIENTATION=-